MGVSIPHILRLTVICLIGKILTEDFQTEDGNKPIRLNALDFFPNGILLEWQLQITLDDNTTQHSISQYEIFYKSLYEDGPVMHKVKPINDTYNLTSLRSNTQYEIWLNALISPSEMLTSNKLYEFTDIGGPSEPILRNLTCKKDQTMYVHLERSEKYVRDVDFYYIYIWCGKQIILNTTFPAQTEYLEVMRPIEHLLPCDEYTLRLQASSRSIKTERIILGNLSDPFKFKLEDVCDIPVEPLHPAIITAISLGVLIVILVVIMYLSRRFRSRAAYNYLDFSHCLSSTVLTWHENPKGYPRPNDTLFEIELFPNHVADMHADGDFGFSREYDALQRFATAQKMSCEESKHPLNRAKNRYMNIVSFDHTRVRILTRYGYSRNPRHYINANYVDGFEVTNAYIATQGPLPSTFATFWRIIWEQRVFVIVMVTNLVERGNKKCDRYWPNEGSESYGIISVKFVKECVFDVYTVRTFTITHTKLRDMNSRSFERTVSQYHYTNWPDHGTPDSSLQVLNFVQRSSVASPIDAGPIVVHCSAGVGRTGTYIVLDTMLKQIKKTKQINVFGFLRHIRGQRNSLVQTEEQYIFIQDALAEFIQSGETNISLSKFSEYVRFLQGSPSTESETRMWKPLDVLYNMATSYEPKDYHYLGARKYVNKVKNRDIRPVESFRLSIRSRPGEDGSDYVNASWMNGFNSLHEFIVTQHPLANTRDDFWRMVRDHRARTIVLLSDMSEDNMLRFWPTELQPIILRNMMVHYGNESMEGSTKIINFVLRSFSDFDEKYCVKMLHHSNWPHCFNDMEDWWTLPDFIYNSIARTGPIVVIDRNGGADAGTFCVLYNVKHHFMFDTHVNVYMYVNLYHKRRPGIWSEQKTLLDLYLAADKLAVEKPPNIIGM